MIKAVEGSNRSSGTPLPHWIVSLTHRARASTGTTATVLAGKNLSNWYSYRRPVDRAHCTPRGVSNSQIVATKR